MGAKNWVLEGDYKHKAVIMQGGKAVLNVGLMKNLKLDSSTIDQIEVVDEDSPEKHGFRRGARRRRRSASGSPGRRGGRDREDEGGSCGGDSVQGWEAVPSGTGRHTVQRRSNSRCSEEKKRPGVRPLGVFLFEILHVATLLQFLFEAALKARVLGALRGVDGPFQGVVTRNQGMDEHSPCGSFGW